MSINFYTILLTAFAVYALLWFAYQKLTMRQKRIDRENRITMLKILKKLRQENEEREKRKRIQKLESKLKTKFGVDLNKLRKKIA